MGFVIIVGLVIWAGTWLFDQIKALWPLLLCASGIGVGLLVLDRVIASIGRRREVRHALAVAEAERARLIAARQRRRGELLARFERAEVVDAILAGQIWHDMSKEELIESWGRPADVSTKVMKTKIKEIYKYDQRGKNRFRR